VKTRTAAPPGRRDPRHNTDFGEVPQRSCQQDITGRMAQIRLCHEASLTNTAQAWLQCALTPAAEQEPIMVTARLQQTSEIRGWLQQIVHRAACLLMDAPAL
jgi:hypothetical protein